MQTQDIQLTTPIIKEIAKQAYYNESDFINDCLSYIEAIKSGRMCCHIHSVSKSGMSRVMSFNSCEMGKDRSYYRQYTRLFEILGYKVARSGNYAFAINGFGMDMVFNTNYNNIHTFKRLGLISATECESLARMTPTVL